MPFRANLLLELWRFLGAAAAENQLAERKTPFFGAPRKWPMQKVAGPSRHNRGPESLLVTLIVGDHNLIFVKRLPQDQKWWEGVRERGCSAEGGGVARELWVDDVFERLCRADFVGGSTLSRRTQPPRGDSPVL